ncbi:MAG: type II toxin-antitoxin system mRNA interferase toxin, RelE/StbE family [Patescibacteria group bacterium]
MNIYFSQEFIKNYRKITKKNVQLKKKIKIRLSVFRENPKHPSLRLHRLKGKMIEDWSISVQSDLRIIFTYVLGGILLVDIGNHKEVYK